MLDKRHKKQVAGVLFCGVSILLIFAFFSSDSGLFGNLVEHLKRFTGTGVLLAAYFFWITGVSFFYKEKDENKDFMLDLLAWLLFTCCFLIITGKIDKGGNIGSFVYQSFVYVFGNTGTIILAYLLTLVSLLITFRIDLVKVFLKINTYIKSERLKDVLKRFLVKQKNKENSLKEENISTDSLAQTHVFDVRKTIEKEEDVNNKKSETKSIEENKVEEKPKQEKSEKNENKSDKKRKENIKKSKDQEDNSSDISEEIKEKKGLEKESETEEFVLPPVELLDDIEVKQTVSEDELQIKGEKLLSTLSSFKIQAEIIATTIGPSVTRFELRLAAGIKVSKLLGLSNDIGVTLATKNIRIEAPIPGKSAIGIEIPNENPMLVPFRQVIDKVKKSDHSLRMGLGKNINGKEVISNLGKMPHLLIAGSTGSGKSVCVNTIIASMLFNAYPDDLKFIMVDPKMVELSVYNGIPHLLIPVVTDPKKAAAALGWAVEEMERRYSMLADYKVKKLEEFNEKMQGLAEEYPSDKDKYEKLPYIVIIIDELADLMVVARNEVEESIMRIAQKARAVGIHLIIATQRPSVNVITGVIKANLPSRISFAVQSQTDSRTILDQKGAESLIGKGDMLFWPIGQNAPMRMQGAFVSNEEVERLVSYWAEKMAPQYDEDVSNTIESAGQEENQSGASTGVASGASDELLPEAVRIVVHGNKASISLLQRKLSVGHSRAARLMDIMEEKGIVSQMDHRNRRQILIKEEEIDNYI